MSGRGFDAFVGNPPFIGGRRIRSTLGDEYLQLHQRRMARRQRQCRLLRLLLPYEPSESYASRGYLGLIATNTIAQGDTRETGLATSSEQTAQSTGRE